MREWFGISVRHFSDVIAGDRPNKKNPRQPCQRGFPNNFRNGLGKTLA
ncbi:hypothetical protein AB395_00004099 [Sinorhizobium fredii CCBAU 45436]|jgi:hypothetical protein|nr:hypothetical protein SF83666_c38900 [Sinorhizobium fredii CCBAU 83666]AWI59723.1 hypothetical protein AB395_00004099 [Sinorhizobium fredii CCBAU 45436]AWM27348.1 hypothetical protein AOX55_00004127 [Sinorhizobium fredii CCBAU 25509]